MYRIVIEETSIRELDVEAESFDDAIEAVEEEYNSIPDATIKSRRVKVFGPNEDGKETETGWHEL